MLGHDLGTLHPTELVYESVSAAVGKDHSPGGLNGQQKVIVLQIWRLEVLLRAQREDPPSGLPLSLVEDLSPGLALVEDISILLSVCLCISKSPLLIKLGWNKGPLNSLILTCLSL